MFRIFGDSVTFFKVDKDHRFDLSVKDELQFFTKLKPENGRKFYVIFILSLVLMYTIIPVIVDKKRNNNKIELDSFEEEPHMWYNKSLEALLPHIGQILSVDELDTILGIIDIVPSKTQRFKRSNLIKETNRLYGAQYGHELIARKQDVEDGRKNVYQIGLHNRL